jgi:hypothetical protein
MKGGSGRHGRHHAHAPKRGPHARLRQRRAKAPVRRRVNDFPILVSERRPGEEPTSERTPT